jgi:hypothetical protein
MTDLDLFKEIVRAVSGVAHEDTGKAVAKVRALLAQPTEKPAEVERPHLGSAADRMHRGGKARSGDGE